MTKPIGIALRKELTESRARVRELITINRKQEQLITAYRSDNASLCGNLDVAMNTVNTLSHVIEDLRARLKATQ